jgi:hypothetical protein
VVALRVSWITRECAIWVKPLLPKRPENFHQRQQATPALASVAYNGEAGIEVTIGTSPAGSKFICHTKGIVSDRAAKGGELWCWEGSTNFSLSAWQQVNTAMVFASQQWRDEFVAQFEALRDFAWANERDLQLMSQPPADVGKAPSASRQRNGLKGTPDHGAVAGRGGHRQN